MKFIEWDKVTAESTAESLPCLLDGAEQAIAEIERMETATFETLVWRMDDATRELWRTWGNVNHMLSVMNSPAWRKLQDDFQERIVAFSLRVGQSRALHDLAKKALAAEREATGPDCGTRVRILEKMVQSAELAGVGLEGAARTRFNEIQAALAKLANDIRNAVIDATDAYVFEKDGRKWTIDDGHYPETMKTCADREVRENLYRARSVRAPENAARIAEMLKLRREEAAILGFANYAELSLATKCAPSVNAVFAMIDELDRATEKIAADEDRELGEGLEPWDRAYAAERLRERKYAYSEEELKKYFAFGDVLAGLFRMTDFLFGVTVREMTGAEKPETWHPDVRFYEVSESGRPIAYFYLDPYVRNGLKSGGAWMNEMAGRCDRRGDLPVAVMVLNLPEADADGRCLMPFREVETLFHEFGHALQHMLTRIGEEGAAGINLVEWDAVEVASQFMENWCLDDRTGIAVPAELKAKVRAAKNFRAASACRRQLAFGHTDLELHLKPCDDANAVKERMFRHYGMPFLPEDRFLNAFTHIFGGGYAAGYYGYKWSEVMSADCYGAFEEAGLGDDAAMTRLGHAYRETVLGLGGSVSAYEVFRRFRGRAPTSAALLRQQGLA